MSCTVIMPVVMKTFLIKCLFPSSHMKTQFLKSAFSRGRFFWGIIKTRNIFDENYEELLEHSISRVHKFEFNSFDNHAQKQYH